MPQCQKKRFLFFFFFFFLTSTVNFLIHLLVTLHFLRIFTCLGKKCRAKLRISTKKNSEEQEFVRTGTHTCEDDQFSSEKGGTVDVKKEMKKMVSVRYYLSHIKLFFFLRLTLLGDFCERSFKNC